MPPFIGREFTAALWIAGATLIALVAHRVVLTVPLAIVMCTGLWPALRQSLSASR